MNEYNTKLRKADWLEYICFQPYVSDAIVRQNNLLSGAENPIDSLLKAAFDLTDVHDSVTINKIMEDSAQAHVKKIVNIQQKILSGDLEAHENIKGT
jgi:hypothetical protein